MRDRTETEAQAERTAAMRLRIVEAAHRVVASDGVPALTFRAVARAAKVSLGTVSYHFGDKTELMQAAVLHSRERFRGRCAAAWQRARQGVPLADCFADLAELLTVTTRDEIVVDYELFLAAFDHDATRGISVEWSQDIFDDLGGLTDPDRAALATYFFEGLCLHAAKLGRSFPAAEVLPLFRQIFGSP